jgi:NADH-quinone oxidoreductase subunit C
VNLPEIQARLKKELPDCRVEVVTNGSPSAQHSLLIDRDHGFTAARWLRDVMGLDFCSNATAVDWPDREKTEKVKLKQLVDGEEKEVEQTVKTTIPGFLEMVYHLFSTSSREFDPVIVRFRTGNRTDQTTLPSLTPIWRSAEFQEREAFDLFGVVFEGHPDLRRILMWDGFTDHPMRKDYVPPPEEE